MYCDNPILAELSESVALKYKIKAYEIDSYGPVWLHEENITCFELAIKNELSIMINTNDSGFKFVIISHGDSIISGSLVLSVESKDMFEATRVAILKALLLI